MLQPPAGASGDFTIQLRDFASASPVAGVTVKACAKSDTSCATPLASGTSDAKGAATLSAVPLGAKGFDGYFDLAGAGIVPSLVYRTIPMVGDKATVDVPTVTPAVFGAIASSLGTTLDATRGHVAATSLDCARQGAPGVVITASAADAMSRTFYTVKDVPSASATATDASNTGGVLNVPVGTTTVTGTIQATSTAYAKVDVPVRAATLTVVYLFPTP